MTPQQIRDYEDGKPVVVTKEMHDFYIDMMKTEYKKISAQHVK